MIADGKPETEIQPSGDKFAKIRLGTIEIAEAGDQMIELKLLIIALRTWN